MNRILEVNIEKRIARVQPGVILDTLRAQAERHQLTFGPDPSTHSRCSLGGMIGNNSCGTHSLLAGKTVDNVHDLTILLYDGTELTVGATSEEELEAIVRREDVEGPFTPPFGQFETNMRSAYAPGSHKFRDAYRATTSISSCPRMAFTSRARSSDPRARARLCLARRFG